MTRLSTQRKFLNGLVAVCTVGLALTIGAVAEAAPAGKVTQYKIPSDNSSPRSITEATDGNLWFTQSFIYSESTDGSQSVARITPDGVVTEFPVCNFCFPGDIAQGSDGDLYFTRNDAPLGRISADGEVSIVGNFFQFNGGSVAAHGDDIWVTDFNNNSLWRYDIPSGELTEFPTGSSVRPSDVVVAPDGNVWFTDISPEGQIGRFDPATGIFTMVNVDGHPRQINVATDGAVWFTERFTPQAVGRLDTGSLAVSLFAVDGGPEDIAPGANGTMWFTRSTAGNVAQIDSSGVILAESKAIRGSEPFGITDSASGHMWFTMLSANRIGKLGITP